MLGSELQHAGSELKRFVIFAGGESAHSQVEQGHRCGLLVAHFQESLSRLFEVLTGQSRLVGAGEFPEDGCHPKVGAGFEMTVVACVGEALGSAGHHRSVL
jgi:hypothetical protein